MNGALRQTLYLALLWLAGCAATPADLVVAEGPEPDLVEDVVEENPDIVCAYESRTGTRTIERRCYRRDELEEIERRSKEVFRTRAKRGSVYIPIHPEDPRRVRKR